MLTAVSLFVLIDTSLLTPHTFTQTPTFLQTPPYTHLTLLYLLISNLLTISNLDHQQTTQPTTNSFCITRLNDGGCMFSNVNAKW